MTQVTIEKLQQERLWIIRLYSNDDASVDAWEQAVRAYLQHVQYRNERYLIYDLSAVEKISLTPYLQQRIVKLAYDNPQATGRVGIVMHISPMLLYVFEPFTRLMVKRIQPNLQVKFFHLLQPALDWVLEILPDELSR